MKPLSILKKSKTDTNFFISAKKNDREGRNSTITPYGVKIALTLPTEGNETNETQTQKTFSIMTMSPSRKSRNKKRTQMHSFIFYLHYPKANL